LFSRDPIGERGVLVESQFGIHPNDDLAERFFGKHNPASTAMANIMATKNMRHTSWASDPTPPAV
jgi:hypothetical protein